ncbi:MAG: preprotein translocase subunit SecY [Patescibacteria group bacterium]
MFKTLATIWSLKDLRRRILVTLALILFVRVLSHIPLPGVDIAALKQFFDRSQLFGLLDIFSGGTMSRFSLIMMGVGPYINASIITQLLTYIIPSWEAMKKEGDEGRRKINQWTRYLTIPLALLQSYGMLLLLKNQGGGILTSVDSMHFVSLMLIVTAGSVFLMWLGELITENGIGNGTSLIIMAGILSSLPSIIQSVGAGYTGLSSLLPVVAIAALSFGVIIAIIYINEGNRFIPVSYARRQVGASMYGGGVETQLPLKINTAGVIPIIFALSFMIFPTIIANFFTSAKSEKVAHFAQWIGKVFSVSPPSVWYGLAYFVLVMLFTFFYTSVVFNPTEIAENIQKQGGFVPGMRPGTQTASYLGAIINRLTITGALFLAIIAVLPLVVQVAYPSLDVLVGGTSILIIVSVILETARQMHAQIVMRKYDNY